LVQPFETWIPTRQDWQKPDKVMDHSVDLWFTDALVIHGGFGAGIFGPLYNHKGKHTYGQPF
jgi:hypothetical protein